jgi:hypothetical protein
MPNFGGYRERKAEEQNVFIYNSIPEELKIQLYHIWTTFFEQAEVFDEAREYIYQRIEKMACERIPLEQLPYLEYYGNQFYCIYNYLKEESDYEVCLEIIEIINIGIELVQPVFKYYDHPFDFSYSPKDALKDINERFRKQGIGYQYIENKIIRVDNNFLNAETVIQTFSLISEEKYKNVNVEYLTAHEHFRYKRNADCLTWCLKAYESTMKIIIKLNGWDLPDTPVATKLVKLLFEKEFFPSFLEAAMNNLRSFMENSINTIRNKRGGHGQGDEEVTVPDSLASFMLYIAGATVRLLVETQKEREYAKN